MGELEIAVPRRPAGEVEIDVRFTYDNNGILEADVRIPLTGEAHTLVIENNPGVLTPTEIQERLKALDSLKIHPRDQQVNTHMTAQLERLYQGTWAMPGSLWALGPASSSVCWKPRTNERSVRCADNSPSRSNASNEDW